MDFYRVVVCGFLEVNEYAKCQYGAQWVLPSHTDYIEKSNGCDTNFLKPFQFQST